MLAGLMMDRPLLLSGVIEHAAEVFADVEIVSQTTEGGIHRYGYAAARARIHKLANALRDLGVAPGDRVATIAWNGYRHVELYYAITGIGAVCHTINPRLFPEQMAYIVNHAGDKLLFFDTTFAPLIEKLRGHFKSVQTFVAMTDRAHMPALDGVHCYEDVLAKGADTIRWPDLDERTACALCYTSGTTAEPKGALYSHRSSVLHSLFVLTAISRAFGPDRSILPVVPLFHVNAWGLPYIAPLTGTKLVMPGARLDGASLFELMEAEHVYGSWGVPTVWLGLIAEMKKRGRKPVGLKQVLIGGSAAPKPMIEAFEKDFGIDVVQGWGMTEMSPVGSIGVLTPDEEELDFPARVELKAKAGRRVYGVDFKIVDEAGTNLPHDDKATGELYVRGPAIVSGYFNNPDATAKALDKDGWFATGDVARITLDGWLSIVDRTKDLVKSGGEWISSIDVENVAMSVAGIANCAVIGVPHPKWTERPLLIAVKAPGADPKPEDILAALAAKLAKWQLPDDVVFVDALPMTATGKISKKDLRAKFADHPLKGSFGRRPDTAPSCLCTPRLPNGPDRHIVNWLTTPLLEGGCPKQDCAGPPLIYRGQGRTTVNFKGLIIGAGLLLASALPATAQRSGDGAWELLGEEKVGIGADKDAITLSQDENFYRNRSYRRLRFVSEGGEVNLNSIRLVFINGHTEELPVNRELKPGQQVDVDLRSERSYLRRIEMNYGSKFGFSFGSGGIRLNQATMKVYGENVRAAQPPPPPAPQASANWHAIGSESFDRSDRQVRIRVGRREGRIGQIAFMLEGEPITPREVIVKFANNDTQTIRFDQEMRNGDRTRPIDLEGDRRVIEDITIILEPRRRPGAARITVMGTERAGGGGALGIASPPAAPVVSLTPPRAAAWQIVTTERFDRRRNQIRMRVDKREGRLEQIALQHEGDQVDIREIVVRYASGDSQTIKLDQEIRNGERTTPIDLEGGYRSVDDVTVHFYPRLRPGPVALSLLGHEYPSPAVKSEWVNLGTQTVGFVSDRDVIRVGQPEDWYRDRGFDKLHFVAERNDLHLMEVRVVYLNGQAEAYRIDRNIQSGGMLSLDLPGRRSYIREIEMNYKSRAGFGGQSAITAYGEPVTRRN